MNLIEKAARIAVIAHDKQTRKSDGSPYIVHPFMTALKLLQNNFSDIIISAALVHDVLEDTDFSEKKLRETLGDEVLQIVKAVSEDKALPWEERKKQYIETVRNAPKGTKAVSIADKIHNLESLMAAHTDQGPEIWNKFNRGKEQKLWFEKEVLKMFKATWQHTLVDEYEALLNKVENLD